MAPTRIGGTRPCAAPRPPGPRAGRLLLGLWLTLSLPAAGADRGGDELRLSVYATAGDVLRHLATDTARTQALAKLRPLDVTHLFLEGRRGDEYVPPATLAAVREFFAAQGVACSGGIATVPGGSFGVRQQGGLDWLDWEAERTQRDVRGFFAENAPLFDALIVDDFFCTGDTSPEAVRRRGERSWSDYRRDLLVSLMEPLMFQPARAANPAGRLILKFPQWYDRFHLFGYDPPRMAAPFDAIWVGTEVRNPATRRMGFVQPTQGYMNFRWLAETVGDKVLGAWFDHIECTPQNFVDQAYLSVLAGARELTLFRLGDVLDDHPGDALLATRLPELRDFAAKVRGQRRQGAAYFKPPGSEAEENLYLMDYLGMLGLPVLPCAQYPHEARVAILGVQAAADPAVLERARAHLERGATLVLTPAFVRRAGPGAAALAGVEVAADPVPAEATRTLNGVSLEPPVDVEAEVRVTTAETRMGVDTARGRAPWLTRRAVGPGQVLLLNVRTFSEADFRAVGEWLLAPRARGLAHLAQPVADELRGAVLPPLGVEFAAPAGVALALFERTACLYNFRPDEAAVQFEGRRIVLPAHRAQWVTRARLHSGG